MSDAVEFALVAALLTLTHFGCFSRIWLSNLALTHFFSNVTQFHFSPSYPSVTHTILFHPKHA